MDGDREQELGTLVGGPPAAQPPAVTFCMSTVTTCYSYDLKTSNVLVCCTPLTVTLCQTPGTLRSSQQPWPLAPGSACGLWLATSQIASAARPPRGLFSLHHALEAFLNFPKLVRSGDASSLRF